MAQDSSTEIVDKRNPKTRPKKKKNQEALM
jgi:hypothetical protein